MEKSTSYKRTNGLSKKENLKKKGRTRQVKPNLLIEEMDKEDITKA